ncbi:MAG: ABC transporter ATP-binding protein [Bacillota bacterium]
MRTYIHLKEFLLRHKWKYIWGVIVLIAVDVLQLITPRLLGQITDMLGDSSLSMKDIYKYIIYILLIASGVAILRYTWRMLVMGTSREIEYWLRSKFFAHLELLSPSFFNNRKTGDLMAHATNDINAVRMAFGPGVVMITDSIFLTASVITILFVTIDIRLTLIALLPLPVIAAMMIIFSKKVMEKNKEIQEAFSHLTDKVQESISGIRVVKSFVQEKKEILKFAEANKENVDKNMSFIKMWGAMFPMVTFISLLSFLITLGVGGGMVIDNRISLGQFVSFIAYLGLLTWPMMAVGWVVNILQRGAASMVRINEILETEPDICDDENTDNTITLDSIEACVEFKGLTFTYPNSKIPALKDINIKLEKGKTLAVVGKTGSGKTTLVNLLLRLYNAPKGELTIGNKSIDIIPLKVLRDCIGYVPQDNYLFSTSIKDNIAFSNPSLSMEKIEEAAKIAQVYDNIIEFPDKFDTILGERGVTLSGGQKQRVSIARAIAKDPKILILDDSLSAVDTKTEEKILEDLKKVMNNRTSIIIAHRISTIKDADEIVVLDEGRIIERGTHEELVAINGLYNSIYQKQLLEEKIENEI